MSDSDSSDGTAELRELIAEYDKKAAEKQEGPQSTATARAEETPPVVEPAEPTAEDAPLDKPAPRKSKKKSNRKKPKPDLNMPVPMDKVVFGDRKGLLTNLASAVGVVEAETPSSADETHERKAEKRKPAWTDPDDEEIQVGEVKRETKFTGPLDHLRKDKSYKEYLTTKFARIVSQPKWAALDGKAKSEDSDDDELLHTVGFLANTKSTTLTAHHLGFKRLKDLNRATYAEGPITSIQFHPSSTAALVAGDLGTATIYSIDGQMNEKLHSMHFQNFPLKCVRIKRCGEKAILGSFKPYYYVYDLLTAQETRYNLPRHIHTLHSFELSACGQYMAVAGRMGTLHLFDARSYELIHSFKQENPIVNVRFTADSRRMICCSQSCDIGIFSLRQQRLEHWFNDDGCISGRALDLSPNQRLLATGSMEGVVNVYDFEHAQSTRTPEPLKRLLNLTTAISDVKFNHTSELLAMSSKEVQEGVRLAHFPSGTVYTNFPGFKSDVGKIRTVEFSPSSGYLALGNRSKEVPLFRLKHFLNY